MAVITVADDDDGEGLLATAVTTVADDNNDRERLLNSFPFRDEELNVLLKLAAAATDGNGTCLITSFSTWIGEDHHHRRLLPFVEEHVLPSSFSNLLLSTAMGSVFVIDPQGDYDVFFEAMATCLGRRGPRSVLDLLFTMAQKEQTAEDSGPVRNILLDWVYRLTLSSHILMDNDDDHSLPSKEDFENLQAPKAWVESLEKEISRPAWKQWVDETCPDLATSLSMLMNLVVFPNTPSSSTSAFRPKPLKLPMHRDYFAWTNQRGGKQSWSIPATLALMGLGGPYRCLYSTENHGRSLRTMQQALWSYAGTTLMLIHTTDGDTFGYYTESPWKAGSTKWFGSSYDDSFLFTLEPRVKVYPPRATADTTKKASTPQRQYLRLPQSHQRAQFLTGLGVDGVTQDRPRLHITESLERCTASPVGRTYESGPLLSDGSVWFDVDVLEVYCLHFTEESLQEATRIGNLRTGIREATRLQVAQVKDKSQFLDDFKRGILLDGTFGHRDQVHGRYEFD